MPWCKVGDWTLLPHTLKNSWADNVEKKGRKVCLTEETGVWAEDRSVRRRHCRFQQTETTESQHLLCLYIHLSISPCMGVSGRANLSCLSSRDCHAQHWHLHPSLPQVTGSQTWPFSGVIAQEIQTHKQASSRGAHSTMAVPGINLEPGLSLWEQQHLLSNARQRTEGCRYKLLFGGPGCAVLREKFLHH